MNEQQSGCGTTGRGVPNAGLRETILEYHWDFAHRLEREGRSTEAYTVLEEILRLSIHCTKAGLATPKYSCQSTSAAPDSVTIWIVAGNGLKAEGTKVH